MKISMSVLMVAVMMVVVGYSCESEDDGAGSGIQHEDYSCASCTDSPDAEKENDGKYTGVYKGVIVDVDSERVLSGTLKLVITADGSQGDCDVFVGGERFLSDAFYNSALTVDGGPDAGSDGDVDGDADDDFDLEDGQIGLVFASDKFELRLVVDEEGEVEDSDFEWEGESARVVIVPESSDVLVECFEGTWEGTAQALDGAEVSGVWNFVVWGSELSGRYDGDGWGTSGDFHGTNAGTQYSADEDDGDHLADGTREKDVVAGSWAQGDNASGTWTGKRML